MALRALGTVVSRRAAGQLRAIAAPLITERNDNFWAGAAQEIGAPANRLGDSSFALSPWSLTTFRGKKSATKKLTDALDDELEHEQENYKQDELLESGPPNGFQLEDTPGKTRIILKKKHRDLEEIEIDLLVNDQPPPYPTEDTGRDPDSDEPEARPASPQDPDSGEVNFVALFNVSVMKGNESLVFECESDGAYLDIQKVMLEKKGGNEDMTDYLGPMYDDLDEELKSSWEGYLEERGINAPMGDYLLQLAHDKEQREYMAWLKKVKTFVSK